MEVKLGADILGLNDEVAADNRRHLQASRVFTLNLLGSPGSGKTTLLEQTIARLKDRLRIAVIEGDLFTTKDADRIERHSVPVVQINTGGGCHLDARMVSGVLDRFDLGAIDLLIIENVGNLVCPAEFQLGEDNKAVVLSVTEGDDKPLKYPLIFREAAAAVLNKSDLLPYTDFDLASATRDITGIHPGIALFPLSCRTGDGVDAWCDWLYAQVTAKQTEGSGP